LSAQPQAPPPLPLDLAPAFPSLGCSPTEALSSAFDDTLRLLFQPFDARHWIKLSIVCIFLGGGTSSAAFNWSLGALPSDVRFHEALERVRQYLAEHLWLILLATALGLALGLVLLYLRATFRFVLVDSIVRKDVQLGAAWGAAQPLGRSYFWWLLGVLVAVGALFAAGAVAAFPYLRTLAATGSRSLAGPIILAGCLMAVVVVGLLLALVITLTDDLAVPLMYAERIPLHLAWRKLWQKVRAEAGNFTVYVLLRFVVSVTVGMFVLFLLFPVLVGFFSGAIIAGALVVLALRLLGLMWFWNPLTIILAAVALLLLSGLLLILLSVVGMPGQVFLQDFGMRFMAARVPALEALWRWPAPSAKRR